MPIYSLGSDRQGIVHVIGPELGVTQPGMTIVCGDSHTATHGAFGALAFGIGTSEVEHVLATQCLVANKPKSMRILYTGELGFGVTAKDLILATIGQMSTSGAVGHVVEFAGPAIEALSMEGRMTVCNMTIEGGGRAGMIAPDETTFAWVAEHAGIDIPDAWRALKTDDGATLRPRDHRRRERDQPAGDVGDRARHGRRRRRGGARADDRGPRARARLHGPARRHADPGHRAGPRLHRLVHEQPHRRPARRRRGRARAQGRVDASARWSCRAPRRSRPRPRPRASTRSSARRASTGARAGCSMCLGMNPDTLAPGERCASTSNRNFEGRQGRGGRTHLVSPQMAAAAAIEGRFVDIREWS